MMITFEYDEERARHATLWLLKQHGTLDHIKLLKLVFLADLRHLAAYGRPIVGGPYFAMEHGPVASELYDELKLRSISGTTAVNDYLLRGVEEPNEDYLSQSDVEILRAVNEEFGARDRYVLSDLTHKYEAWRKNYLGEAGGKKAYPIPYEDLLAEAEQSVRDLVDDTQRAQRALG
jgi:uncharacterized phage-associated protein